MMSNQGKRSYTSSVRDARAVEAKTMILSAAKELFQSKGFEKVTIAELARSAGVSGPTVYSLFKSKRGVLLALMDEALPSSSFDELVEEVGREKTAAGRLRVSAKMTRVLYSAEQEQMGFLRGASVIGPEFQEIEKEQEERRYQRQEETVRNMAEEGLLAEGLTVVEARDILWAFTGRDMYRLFVMVRGWSGDKYEKWLGDVLVKMLAGEGD